MMLLQNLIMLMAYQLDRGRIQPWWGEFWRLYPTLYTVGYGYGVELFGVVLVHWAHLCKPTCACSMLPTCISVQVAEVV